MGCSTPKPITTIPKRINPFEKVINSNDIEHYLHANNIKIQFAFAVHTNYVVLRGEWLREVFQPRFKEVLSKLNYDTNIFNCVGYSAEATQLIKHLLRDKNIPAGVCWGEIYYDQRDGIRHCVNALFIFSEDKLRLLFFEPQIGEFILFDLNSVDLFFLRLGSVNFNYFNYS